MLEAGETIIYENRQGDIASNSVCGHWWDYGSKNNITKNSTLFMNSWGILNFLRCDNGSMDM